MATDVIVNDQNQTPKKMRDNGDGSHTPYVAVDTSGGAQSNVNIDQVGGAAYGLGQTTKAGSAPVVLPSDQVVPVSLPATTPVRANALSTSVVALRSSAAGKISNYQLYNPNAVTAYIQIFDVATAGSVSLGSTVPTLSLALPPGSAANLSRIGWSFTNGIQVAATTTATGSTALTTPVDANFGIE